MSRRDQAGDHEPYRQGFALDSMKATGRLVETGGFEKKDRITHRLPIESLSGVDAEVKTWLKYAYDLDA